MTKFDQEIYDLIIKGKVVCKDQEEEDAAIELLKKAAAKEPDTLWSIIFESFSFEGATMALPAMAAYLASPNTKKHFNYKIRKYFIDLLTTLNPVSLLELTEYIQSKVFGEGLGSGKQKLLRNVLEQWDITTLKEYGSMYPEELNSLIKILHPKFQGEKGKVVKEIFSSLKKNF